jgi:hypothetical protein
MTKFVTELFEPFEPIEIVGVDTPHVGNPAQPRHSRQRPLPCADQAEPPAFA